MRAVSSARKSKLVEVKLFYFTSLGSTLRRVNGKRRKQLAKYLCIRSLNSKKTLLGCFSLALFLAYDLRRVELNQLILGYCRGDVRANQLSRAVTISDNDYLIFSGELFYQGKLFTVFENAKALGRDNARVKERFYFDFIVFSLNDDGEINFQLFHFASLKAYFTLQAQSRI